MKKVVEPGPVAGPVFTPEQLAAMNAWTTARIEVDNAHQLLEAAQKRRHELFVAFKKSLGIKT